MTIRINQLRQDDVRDLTVKYDGDEVNLSYKPAVYTANFEEELRSLLETQRLAGANARGLAELLVSWDVEDEDGNPWPPTLENLRTLSGQFTEALLQAIYADINKPAPPTSNGHSTEVPDAPRRARR